MQGKVLINLFLYEFNIDKKWMWIKDWKKQKKEKKKKKLPKKSLQKVPFKSGLSFHKITVKCPVTKN